MESRLWVRMVEQVQQLGTDASDEQAFQEIAERSGLQSPLEHALAAGSDQIRVIRPSALVSCR